MATLPVNAGLRFSNPAYARLTPVVWSLTPVPWCGPPFIVDTRVVIVHQLRWRK